eukprot:11038317-Alexandrium_andersonii.AAC.1
MADWSSRIRDFAISERLNAHIRWQIRNLRERRRRTHRSGASGANSEAVPGPVQFQVRMREA